jgi:alpha-N-acetylglucosamine transferase
MAARIPSSAAILSNRFSIRLVATLFLLAAVGLLLRDAATRFAINSFAFDPSPVELQPENAYAFATFLNRPYTPLPSDDDDKYFIMTRMMAFQLLHNPETKSNKSYPFVVMTSEGVEESKIDRLRLDGAIVISVRRVTSPTLATKNSQWWDQLTKLRLWEMMQYEKIAYFDSDTLILRNVDGIFEDEAAVVTNNLQKPEQVPADEGPQPSQYMFAGVAGQGGFKHTYPPAKGRSNLNAGCFVIKPSLEVFNYYMRMITVENKYPRKYMEQAMLGYTHRLDGNMPWKELNWKWNTNYAVWNDSLAGIATLHSKYWQTDHDIDLKEFAYDLKGRTLGYFMAKSS